MGKLTGILPIEGTVGNITFARTADGIVVRERAGVSAQRVATDPAFIRVRENNAEFGRAGKAGSLLFTALRSAIRAKADPRAMSRLMQRLMQVLQGDALNPRGERTVAAGTPALLEGFEFNRAAPLHATLSAPYTVTVTRSNGVLNVLIPALIPAEDIAAPEGATHYAITAVGVEADFAANTYVTDSYLTPVLPLNAVPAAGLNLQAQLPAASTLPLLLALSVSFYQAVNGVNYLLRNGASNALAIVKVDV